MPNARLLPCTVLFLVVTCCLPSSTTAKQAAKNPQRPNVLFIAIDDLNDWATPFGGHPQIKTPNLDQFARSGAVVFQNAHGAGTICCPSRSALLSGFLPSTSGVYGNSQNLLDSPLVQQHATLPEYFSKHGYQSMSRGKIFHAHQTAAGRDVGHWAFDRYVGGSKGSPVDRKQVTSRDKDLIRGKRGPDSEYTRGGGSEFAWGPTQGPKEETSDYKTAQWAAEQLGKKHDQPLFLAVGLSKPHLPFYVPQEFYDLYDADTFKAPPIREDDLDDILRPNGKPRFQPTPDYLWLKENGLIDEAARAYAAASSYADACLGVIFDALKSSPMSDNTIVIVWGDHGWHLGEKLRYRKGTGWIESTRLPLMVRLPGMKGRADCMRPVNLIDLYPTLIELCDLPEKENLDGISFQPLLEQPDRQWKRPSVSIFGYGNASAVSEDYHLIRYEDGTEEFYDLKSDPQEWNNLANQLSSAQKAARDELAAEMPAKFATPVKKTEKDRSGKGLNLDLKDLRPLERLK